MHSHTMARLVAALCAASGVIPLAGQGIAPRPVEAVQTGKFQDPDLRESSGIVPSSTMPGVLYTFNDSGNPPEIFATDSTGRAMGRWRVPHVSNLDWEAMARGPCPVGSCLYLGDIGDNGEKRPTVVLYRLREPARFERFRGAADPAPLDLDSLTFRYPDGPHDAEALYLDRAGSIFVVTKGRHGPVRLFRVPAEGFATPAPVTAELVQDLPITPAARLGRLVTDAATSPNGQRVAIRTYSELYLFPVLGLGRLGTPVVCNVAGLERQGEGIAWLDDRRLLLTGEAVITAGPLHIVTCG